MICRGTNHEVEYRQKSRRSIVGRNSDSGHARHRRLRLDRKAGLRGEAAKGSGFSRRGALGSLIKE
jgi:hypothetical protein